MKTLTFLLPPVLLICETVFAGTPRLVLVPTQTSIRPRQTVTFDVYLLNDSGKPTKAPLLESIKTVYWSHVAPEAKQLSEVTLEGPANFNPEVQQNLAPHSVQSKRIKVEISAQPGSVVEVQALIGKPLNFESNSVLLHCAAK